jgi:uncharacterized protein
MENAVLEALFLSKARIAILKTLLLDSQKQFYLRELALKANSPLRSVQIEVKRLTEAGILESERRGRQIYYRINESCSIVPELRSIFIKTVGIADVIRETLLTAPDAISMAFIYGSFARGDIRADSDIDLFVVGNITLRQLTVLLKAVNIMRVINPTVMPLEEFHSRLVEHDHFISTLINSPKLFLIGGEDGLQRFG